MELYRGANPEGSLASGSSVEKYKLGSECSCGCSGVTINYNLDHDLTVSSFCT